jgi:uncharacterized protein
MSAPSDAPKNRLAAESSPYLRQHAQNPVDWYPWGPEALERARSLDRPILLSVGYSACHWCHVMAHESFEDPVTAELMNAFFINIKIDREERPDLDQLYQGVVQLMGRGGGWPLTVFLTPDLRPFFAGTYFPPQDRHGLPGFPKLLRALDDAWKTERSQLLSQAERFTEGLGFLSAYGLDAPPSELTAEDLVRAARRLADEVDPEFGGFGGAPKFPNPMNVSLLLRAFRRTKDAKLLDAVTLTARRMAEGGLYDQLGGGFHRYSVDSRWLVPHFEKMLYDNAQLLNVYSELHQVAPSPLWKKTVAETVAYVARELTSPEGAFYAAQDADSEGVEGKFFVWTDAELRALLGETEATLFSQAFGASKPGNFEHGQNILERKLSSAALAAAQDALSVEEIDARLDASRRTLFAARDQRVKPGLDDKVLTGWNGLMIRGLAFASRVFGEPSWAAMAARAADFLWSRQWQNGRLLRVHHGGVGKIDAFVEDYGDLAAGLVALFQAVPDPRYLEAATTLCETAVALFWDEDKQAYRVAPRTQSDLLVAPYGLHDNAYPSGASTLTEAQVALAALTGKTSLLEQATRYLKKMRDAMAQNPFGFGHLWLAADAWLDGAAELTVVGEGEGHKALVDRFHATYAPTVALLRWPGDTAVPRILEATLEGRSSRAGQAAAYLCRNFRCEAPATHPDALSQSLEAMSVRV